ncbi:hypothetical protein ACTQ3J_01855 [Oscillospiraceae bacterium LCP25S3_E3]
MLKLLIAEKLTTKQLRSLGQAMSISLYFMYKRKKDITKKQGIRSACNVLLVKLIQLLKLS